MATAVSQESAPALRAGLESLATSAPLTEAMTRVKVLARGILRAARTGGALEVTVKMEHWARNLFSRLVSATMDTWAMIAQNVSCR